MCEIGLKCTLIATRLESQEEVTSCEISVFGHNLSKVFCSYKGIQNASELVIL